MKITFAEEFGFTPDEIGELSQYDVEAFGFFLSGKAQAENKRRLRNLGR